jgi:TetR/AcrR family tetracycline transcriptional repressor
MGRPKAGQERLNRKRILEAALRLVDEEGMEALSMRRLGAELGVDPMSIYRHMPSKEAVISGLVEEVFSEMRLPPPEGADWRERVYAWAEAYVELARSHPNLVLRIVSDAAAVSNAMLRISEPLYAALWEAGLPPRKIALAAGTVVDFVHGHALAGDSSASSEDTAFEQILLSRLEAQPAERSPTMLRVFRMLAEDAADADPVSAFDGSLDVLIKGTEAIAEDSADQQWTK